MCSLEELGCEHLCLMSPTGEQCVCSDGWAFNPDTDKCEGT